MKDKQRKELIKLAAELAWCPNMPSSCIEDHLLHKNNHSLAAMGVKAENQCKKWAVRIREIIEE